MQEDTEATTTTEEVVDTTRSKWSKESCPRCGSDVWREKGKVPRPTCKECGEVFSARFP